jgi:hypothetical protein
MKLINVIALVAGLLLNREKQCKHAASTLFILGCRNLTSAIGQKANS